MIGFLHTAVIHVENFDRRLAAAGFEGSVRHLMREDLLRRARQEGLSREVRLETAAALGELKAAGVELLICSCSTLGGVAEELAAELGMAIWRVDRPMAETAVASGSRVGVVASLASTLGPTRRLLEEVGEVAGRPLEIHTRLCDGAWPLFEAGDLAGYEQLVAGAVAELAADVDVIVLAQASMAGAADRVRVPVPVLNSPDTCVARIMIEGWAGFREQPQTP